LPGVTSTEATATYRQESDILGDFIEDRCVMEWSASIPKSDLYDAYETWCADTKNEPVTQKTFKTRLIEKGIREDKGAKGVRIWRGIRLRPDDDNPADGGGGKGGKGGLFSQDFSLREIYEKVSGTPATLATSGTKGGKSCHPDPLGMPVDQVITLWEKDGKPIIPVPGGVIGDLAKALTGGIPESYYPAIRQYIEEVNSRVEEE